MIEADRVALRRRYARERDKRLRPDGNDQYLELNGQFGRMLEDPYTARAERDPKRDHVTVAFVGGGYHQGASAYFRYIREWRESGGFAGLAFGRR